MLVDRDGTTRVLELSRDPALGLAGQPERSSATYTLPPGSTLLLFTDGLFERRGLDLDDSLALLTATIAESTGLSIDDLCDTLLRVAPHDDDIALVAVRPRLSG